MPQQAAKKRARDVVEGDHAALTVLHRSRMVPWGVTPIAAIATCPDGSVFAVGCEDGKIEICDGTTFHCMTTIPGQSGLELSSLAWAKDSSDPHWRLFCATLGGDILEVDCQQLQLVAPTDSYGGAVWSLSSCRSGKGTSRLLVAACDDGSTRIFSVQPGARGARYERCLAQVEGRTLCSAWSQQGTVVATGGSDGCIHCWDLSTGQELLRITAGSHTGSDTCVWSLLLLPDGTLVSGDSEGAVQFWDGATGTLISRLQNHAADVLSLAYSAGHVFAAGVDPRVAVYHKVSDGPGSTTRWVYLDYKQPHSHDVRALAILPGPEQEEHLLLSGGNDGALILYSADRFRKEHPTRQSKSPQAPLLQLVAGEGSGGLLLHAQGNQLSLFSLGEAGGAGTQASGGEQHHPREGDACDLRALPSCRLLVNTSGTHHIAAAAVAQDGSALACSTASGCKLFGLEGPLEREGRPDRLVGSASSSRQPAAAAAGGASGQQTVRRVKLKGAAAAPAVCLAFAVDSLQLYAADGRGVIRAIDTGSGELLGQVDLSRSSGRQAGAAAAGGAEGLEGQGQQYVPIVTHMAPSPDGKWLAVAVGSSRVELLQLPQLQPVGPLLLVAEAAGGITALAFSPDSGVMVVGAAGNSVSAYEVGSRVPTQWTLQYQEPLGDLMMRLPGSISGLTFNPVLESQSLVVYSAGGLCNVDLKQPVSSELLHRKRTRQKHKPTAAESNPASIVGLNGRLLLLENPCLYFGYLGPNTALLVEKPWMEVLEQLPPPLFKHRYGS